MGLIDFPDPISMFEGAKNAGLEREVINSLISAAYSSWISLMWRSGSSKWAQYVGEGKAMQDAATSVYLSLQALQSKGFLALTVPQDLLSSDNLSKFQTQKVIK